VIKQVAEELGILLDPIYSLAAWEIASELAADSSSEAGVLMLHSGGGLGLHGIAQSYPDQF
jgi:D-cysteine desulfhydrase